MSTTTRNNERVVRYRGPGNGFKIRLKDGTLSPESYATRKGAELSLKGIGSAGGIR